MLSIKSDFKYTVRQIMQSPGFALLSIIVLAGGLSLSLFTISFIYTTAMKPLQLPDGDRIVEICGEAPGGSCLPIRAFEFASIRDEIQSVEDIGVYNMRYRIYIQSDDTFVEAMVTQTEANMFQFSESGPVLGRIFQESDMVSGAEPVAVLSHDFWQLAFERDPTIIDSHISMGGVATRVIGVMPPGFTFPRWSDIWVPAAPELINPVTNGPTTVSIYGYRKEGVSNSEANQEISNLLFRMRQQHPFEDDEAFSNLDRAIYSTDSGYITSLPRKEFRDIGTLLMFGIVIAIGLILFLLACINVGTLLLARTNERMKDISICVALGAPRRRLLMQVMGESILIAVAGTSIAILLTGLWLQGLNVFMQTLLSEEGLQFWMRYGIDRFTIILAVGYAFFTVLATSAVPSWRLINGDFNSVMRDGTRGSLGLSASRFSKSLVVVAVTLISILVYTFTVFITVMYSLGSPYRLIEPDGIYSAEINTLGQFENSAERLQYAQTLQSQLNEHPDTQSVLIAGVTGIHRITLDGISYFSEQDKPTSRAQVISGDISFLGANLLEGRLLDNQDNANSESVAMVSRSLADQLWPLESPIGKSLSINLPFGNSDTKAFRIVGMVSDTPIDGSDLFREEYEMLYLPLGQVDSIAVTAIIRTRGSERASIKILGDTVLGLNSGVTFSILSWVENRQMTSFVIASAISVFSAIGIFAFLVSIAGIFGLTKNSVLLRTQEIGTRRALGASDSLIGRSFTMRGAKQTLLGMLIGLVICAPFAFLISNMAGSNYIIPGTLISLVALLLLFLCTLIAINQPIRTLLRQEPSDLLRHV